MSILDTKDIEELKRINSLLEEDTKKDIKYYDINVKKIHKSQIKDLLIYLYDKSKEVEIMESSFKEE